MKRIRDKLFFSFCCRDFRPLVSKNVQIWDHFFLLFFPKDYKYLTSLDIGLQEVGAKKMLWKLLNTVLNYWDFLVFNKVWMIGTQHNNLNLLKVNCFPNPMNKIREKKSRIRETPNLLNEAESSTNVFVSAGVKKGDDSILFA